MLYKFICQLCNHEFEMEEELAGSRVKCPSCGNSFTAPASQKVVLPEVMKFRRNEEPEPVEVPEDPKKDKAKKKKKKKRKTALAKTDNVLGGLIRKFVLLIFTLALIWLLYLLYGVLRDAYWMRKSFEYIAEIIDDEDNIKKKQNIEALNKEKNALQKDRDNAPVVALLNQCIFLSLLSDNDIAYFRKIVKDLPRDDYEELLDGTIAECPKCTGKEVAACRNCKSRKFVFGQKDLEQKLYKCTEELEEAAEDKVNELKSPQYILRKFSDSFFSLSWSNKGDKEDKE